VRGTRWPVPCPRSRGCSAAPAPCPARPSTAPAAAAAAAVPVAVVPGTGGGGGSGWPAAGRSLDTPPVSSPESVSVQRSRRRSSRGLAPAARAVGRELTQQRGELSLHLDHLAGLVQFGLQTLVLLT